MSVHRMHTSIRHTIVIAQTNVETVRNYQLLATYFVRTASTWITTEIVERCGVNVLIGIMMIESIIEIVCVW
jgi:hypothetical protein